MWVPSMSEAHLQTCHGSRRRYVGSASRAWYRRYRLDQPNVLDPSYISMARWKIFSTELYEGHLAGFCGRFLTWSKPADDGQADGPMNNVQHLAMFQPYACAGSISAAFLLCRLLATVKVACLGASCRVRLSRCPNPYWRNQSGRLTSS